MTRVSRHCTHVYQWRTVTHLKPHKRTLIKSQTYKRSKSIPLTYSHPSYTNMKPSFWRGVTDQWRAIPPVISSDLSGKTVIVTGANIGLGFETAKHFARMNPGKLVLACRNKEKGLEALKGGWSIIFVAATWSWPSTVFLVTDIRDETGCQTVELKLLDLADFESVIAFADSFEKENERLDILVENAALGTFEPQPQFTKNGWELTYVFASFVRSYTNFKCRSATRYAGESSITISSRSATPSSSRQHRQKV